MLQRENEKIKTGRGEERVLAHVLAYVLACVLVFVCACVCVCMSCVCVCRVLGTPTSPVHSGADMQHRHGPRVRTTFLCQGAKYAALED